MRAVPQSLQRELSRFELLMCVIVILVLGALVIHKILGVLAAAEEANMTATLNRVRSAVTLEALTRLVEGDLAGLAALEDSNPMAAMATPPRNYIGERRSPEPEALGGGVWYFDTLARELVYRVEHGQRFHTPLGGPKRARFRVRLRYTDANGNGRFDPRADAFEGIVLEPAERYRWAPGGE